MSEQNEAPQATAGEATAPSAQEAQTVESLPEWSQTLIKDLRAEAAKHRTEKSEAAESAKAEVQAEYEQKLSELAAEKSAVESKLNDKDLELAKVRAAFGVVGVDEEAAAKAAEVASLIQGSSEDEVQAHAEKLRSLFGATSLNDRPSAVDKTPSGKPLALNDDDGLYDAISSALGID